MPSIVNSCLLCSLVRSYLYYGVHVLLQQFLYLCFINIKGRLGTNSSRVGQNCIYIHRIWPYIWCFPCQKVPWMHRIYIWFWPTLDSGHADLKADDKAVRKAWPKSGSQPQKTPGEGYQVSRSTRAFESAGDEAVWRSGRYQKSWITPSAE